MGMCLRMCSKREICGVRRGCWCILWWVEVCDGMWSKRCSPGVNNARVVEVRNGRAWHGRVDW